LPEGFTPPPLKPVIAVVAAIALVLVVVLVVSGGDDGSPASKTETTKSAGPPPKQVRGGGPRRPPKKLIALPAAVEPRSLAFTAPPVRLSKPKYVRAVNKGTARITLGKVHLEGGDRSDFVATDGCNGTSLFAGEACKIVVSFIPARRKGAAARNRTATLILSNDGKGGKRTISLTGTVVGR